MGNQNGHQNGNAMKDLADWLTETEAAEKFGKSTRWLRRLCERGEGPERRERQRDGVRPEPVYNPDDVSRLSTTRPHVMGPGSALTPRNPDTLPDVRTLPPVLEELALVLCERLKEPPRKIPARWVDLEAASARTGLSVRFLRRLIAARSLKSIRDKVTKVLERDLDNLDIADIEDVQMSRTGGRAAADNLDSVDNADQIVQKAGGRG
jgi:hypothetical protein